MPELVCRGVALAKGCRTAPTNPRLGVPETRFSSGQPRCISMCLGIRIFSLNQI